MKLLSTLTFFWALSLSAQTFTPWNEYAQGRCMSEFKKYAASEKWSADKFGQQVADQFNVTAFRNYSQTIGEWTQLHLSEKESAEIIQISQNSFHKMGFDKDCKLVSLSKEWPWHLAEIFKRTSSEDWNNEQLRELVSTGKKGIIYYWSPRFAYSVEDMPRVEQLARKWGYQFTAVVDPRASRNEVEGALTKIQYKNKKTFSRSLASGKNYLRNVSTDLYMRNGFNHFPVMYVYNNKKIHQRWVTGIMTENGLKEMFATFTTELK